VTTANTKDVMILLVDDNPTNLRILLESLKESGYKTLVARSGEGALRQAEFARPDLILLDVMMPPGIDGFETCRRLKKNKATQDIPVIFMTALSDTVDKVKGFEVGGVDYVTKPFDGVELMARVKAHVELRQYQKKLKLSNQRLREINEDLREAQRKLELAARTDPLTQLSNRRDIIEKIEYERIRFKRNQKSFVLILGDIDHFKAFNDTFGHDCGDFVLVSVANVMRSMIREWDQLARWGGEEFLFLLVETDLEGGKIVAEKIRQSIASHSYIHKDLTLSITMTFGVSMFNNYSMTIDECIKEADQALYKGKEQGRNCVAASRPRSAETKDEQ
jgi:diguanylate cyclase (GGDEF)-like protein